MARRDAGQAASTVVIVAAIHAMSDWQRTHFKQMDKSMIEFVRQIAASMV